MLPTRSMHWKATFVGFVLGPNIASLDLKAVILMPNNGKNLLLARDASSMVVKLIGFTS